MAKLGYSLLMLLAILLVIAGCILAIRIFE